MVMHLKIPQQLHITISQKPLNPLKLLTDSITYDITAWSLPFAYGLDCYAFSSTPKIDVAASYEIVKPVFKKNGNPVFAYQIPWNDLHSAKILAQLHKHGVKVRMTVTESFFVSVSVSDFSFLLLQAATIIARAAIPKSTFFICKKFQ